MERIGLTFDEFVDLKLKPPAGADRAFHEAAEMERQEMFPMNLATASSHLRSRGYDCRPEMLELLVRNQVVTPAAPDAWSQADVDIAAWIGCTAGPSVPGDIDGDGDVDLVDRELFVGVLIGMSTNAEEMARSDLNGDGAADGADVGAFVGIILKP